MNEVLFARIRNANIAFLYDSRENSRWGMLRCLPALSYLGVDHFTYPASWRQLERGGWYDFLENEFEVISEIDFEEAPTFGVITNRHYEKETPYSIRPLIERYTIAPSPLVVVADGRNFTPEGAQRPLGHEEFVDRIGSYSQVYNVFEQQYAADGFELPLSDTKNLFIQDNANIYELVTEETLRTAEEVFEVLPSAPYLPLYDAFSRIFEREDTFGTTPLDSDDDIAALGRWLRRRVELDRGIAHDLARELNRKVADNAQTFDSTYARKSTAVADAARVTDHLPAAAQSATAARYRTWLTRFDQ